MVFQSGLAAHVVEWFPSSDKRSKNFRTGFIAEEAVSFSAKDA